jgi:hypothetical protein
MTEPCSRPSKAHTRAARTRGYSREADELTRSRIKTTLLVKALQDNALGKFAEEMSASRIKSAEILLRKVLPDLQAVEHKGDESAPMVVNVRKFS